MYKRFQYISFVFVVLITLVASLLLPTAALADDTPPPTNPPQVVTTDAGATGSPTNAAATQPASIEVASTNAAPTDAAATQSASTDGDSTKAASTDAAATQPASTNAASTNAPPTDTAATQSASPDVASTDAATQPASTEVVLTNTAPSDAAAAQSPAIVTPTDVATQPAVTQTPSTKVSDSETTAGTPVASAVMALADSGSVLTDQNGNAIPLASQQAADILAAGDPYIIRGGTTYHFSTIQAAINFSNAGEVIYVEPGTYTEQLQIQKAITVQGTAPGVIVQSPSSLPLSFTTSAEHHPIIYVHDTNDVSLVDLTVDGGGLGNTYNYDRFDGVAYYNAGGTIQNNTIRDITDTPLDGMQRGVGIYAYNADGSPRTLDVIGNTILDYQKNGMALSGNNLVVDVENNTVTGAGPTNQIAQNGIQVSYGATGKVIGNTVSGNYWTGKYAGPGNNDPATDPNADSAAGILIYEPGSSALDISNNTLTDNQIGIASVAAASLNIHDNTIQGPDHIGYGYPVGIMITDESGWSTDVGLGTNGSITGNEITLNDYGILLLDTAGSAANVEVHQNSITSNRLYGIYNSVFNSSQTTYTDAMDNWWGVSLGPLDPSTGTDHCGLAQSNPGVPANGVSPCVLYHPWLTTDPFASSGGSGGNGHSVSAEPATPIIPITGGQPTTIDCGSPTMTVEVGNTDAIFTGLCGYEVVVELITPEDLPGAMNQNQKFVTGVVITLLKDGRAVDALPVGTSIQVSYLKPSGDASIMAWNGSSWVEKPASNSGDRAIANLDKPVVTTVLVTH